MGARDLTAELVLDAGAHHAEGPFWDAATGRLGWVDIAAGRLHSYDPDTGHDFAVDVGKPLGAAAPRQGGGYVLAVEDGFAVLDPDGSGPEMLAALDTEGGKLRMNDGGCDPQGRFWAGTMAYDLRPGAGSLYRLTADGAVTRVLDSVGISNGLDWTADGRILYFIDSFAYGVDGYEFDSITGNVGARRRVIDLPDPGGSPAGIIVPDGMTLDVEDHLWVAMYGAGEVRRYSPSGELEMVINVPVSCPTSCAFGGSDLDTLYITSMATVAGEQGAGALYACRPGVAGRPARTFAG